MKQKAISLKRLIKLTGLNKREAGEKVGMLKESTAKILVVMESLGARAVSCDASQGGPCYHVSLGRYTWGNWIHRLTLLFLPTPCEYTIISQ